MATRTFAVGYDGSVDADAALRWALALARDTDADVVVVHAVGLLEHATAQLRSNILEESVHVIVSSGGFDPTRVRWHVEDGDPCSVLLRAPGPPLHADMVVVGSRGQANHAGLLLGSTSHELAETCTVPLVIVPSGRAAEAASQ